MYNHLTMDASTVTAQTLAPVAPEKRVATLDILRGFAMFGVLFSNLYVWYGMPHGSTAPDRVVAWIDEWMIDDRFYTLLGFLFGMGFAIQLDRAGARGSDAKRVFLRRMLVLLGIGVVHGLFIWRGDILTSYAVLGFALVLFGRLSQQGLAIAAATVYFLGPYIYPRVAFLTFGIVGGTTRYPPATKAIYAGGTFAQVFFARISDDLPLLRRALTLPSLGFLALFLLGMLVARSGILPALSARSGQAKKWLLWSLAGALLCLPLGIYWQNNFSHWWPAPPRLAMPPTWHTLALWNPWRTFVGIGYDLPVWSESAAYACVLALLSLRPRGAKTLAPLAAVGRMPLTTYLVQSIVCTNLFYGYGLIGWGKLHDTGVLEFSIAFFGVQMAASMYWLRHFQFGPAEWLWRSLAYGRAQTMRKSARVLPLRGQSAAAGC
jgi:uncharacterized protein